MPPDPRDRRRSPSALAPIVALLLAAPACKVVQGVADAPGAIVGAATGGSKKEAPTIDLDEVQLQVRQLADRVVQGVDQGAFLFTEADPSQAAREAALTWRILAAERTYAAATEPRPVAALSNLLALCVYEARVHELCWSTRWGEPDRHVASAWSGLVDEGLRAVDRCLPAEQAQALRTVLDEWRASASEAGVLLDAGAPNVADLARQRQEAGGRTSLFGAIGLNPLDSIEPAAREVARARELAERGLFLAQRAPRLLAWRMELLTLHLTKQPDLQVALQGVDRASKAADSVAATAEALPGKLRVEGDALLQRASSELAAQRAGIVADLERTSVPTKELLGQARETLDAATRLAQALDATTKTVDGFLARLNAPEPAGAAAKPAGAAPEAPPKRPFDPVEYTALAAQITAGLKELDTAVSGLDRSLPAVQRSVDDAAARVDRSVERAYGLALRLVLVAIAAATLAVLLVRAVARRARGRAA